jgi:hypothetical protein
VRKTASAKPTAKMAEFHLGYAAAVAWKINYPVVSDFLNHLCSQK